MIFKIFGLLLIGQVFGQFPNFGQEQYGYPQNNQGYGLPNLQGLLNMGQVPLQNLQGYAQNFRAYLPQIPQGYIPSFDNIPNPLTNLFGNNGQVNPFGQSPYQAPQNMPYPYNNPSALPEMPGLNPASSNFNNLFGQNQGPFPPNTQGLNMGPQGFHPPQNNPFSGRNQESFPQNPGSFPAFPQGLYMDPAGINAQQNGGPYSGPFPQNQGPFPQNLQGYPTESTLSRIWNTIHPINNARKLSDSIFNKNGMLNPSANLNKIGEYAHKAIDAEADFKKEGINVVDRLARAGLENGMGVAKHAVGKLQNAFQDTMDTLENFRGNAEDNRNSKDDAKDDQKDKQGGKAGAKNSKDNQKDKHKDSPKDGHKGNKEEEGGEKDNLKDKQGKDGQNDDQKDKHKGQDGPKNEQKGGQKGKDNPKDPANEEGQKKDEKYKYKNKPKNDEDATESKR